MQTPQMPNFEIPAEMRDVAEKSLGQAKQAVDGVLGAAHKAVAAIEGQAEAAQASVKTIGTKTMTFAEKNIASSFDFAHKVVRAKDIQEVIALQTEFMKSQMAALTEQAKEITEFATKAAMEAAKPKA